MKKDKNILLKSAINEIDICTPDSIAIAVKMLELQGIKTPPALVSLFKLLQRSNGKDAEIRKLQLEAINEIQHLMDSAPPLS